LGVALGLSAALAYGIYIPLVNRLQRGVDSTVATWYICAGVAVILGVAGVMRAELSWTQPMAAWWAMLWLALVSTTFAFVLFLRGLATLGPVRTSIVSTAEPFFVAIMGALFLDQPLSLPVILGGLFIAAAVVLLQRGSPPPAPAASGRRATPSGSR
jgi:drug/metabolite transporter (DMT)-like permease